ncbi:hypothetical protein Cfor_07303 [Coptotermes formosanus]|jgi:hypothetical protein|uniref:Uncharacterized protein n=1 Tax=Coptotermes formosanus TaxID=36987 RepID=A0A6L2PSH4_COPFO|nr:hypothetical protein Cfor_07303 [Coptotermes formosanus]
MKRVSTIALLVCFLASTWANPIEANKEELVETPNTVAPTAVTEDPELPASLATQEKVPEEETVTEKGAEQDNLKTQEAEGVTGRKERVLASRNQANEIGGGNHQLISDSEDALLQKLNNKCSQSDVSACVMLKLLTYMNRLLKKSNIEVFEGLHITQTASQEQVTEDSQPVENPRSTGSEDEETQTSQLMANKLWTFVRTRSLRWSVLPDADVVMSTSPDKGGAVNFGMSLRTGKAVEKGEYKAFHNLKFLNT